MNAILTAALVQWRRQFPEITEDEALADLWCKDFKTNETYAAFMRQMADAEDDRYNIFKHPDQFAGWHVAIAQPYKHGVIKFEITQRIAGGVEKLMGFCKQDVLRVAIELKLCTRPNGFILPPLTP
jgi:hypothetical protein